MLSTVDLPDGGGAPLLGEPLAVEFINTHYAVRGRIRDGIETPAQLSAWLRANAAALGLNEPTAPGDPRYGQLGDAETALFRELRDAIRAIAGAVVEGRLPAPAQVDVVNRAAAATPHWPTLVIDENGWAVARRVEGGAGPAALSVIARNAIELFGGPLREELMACHAPGCVLFFVKDHPRRAWCSSACGNRARAARHYQRHRDS